MKKKIIIINGILLFVFVCFISFSFLPTNAAEIDQSKEKYVAAKSGLNLRSGPGKISKVITLIPFGAMVTIEKSEGNEIFLDGRYGKWVNVKHGNKTGWVFSGFLCDFKPDTAIKTIDEYYRKSLRGYENNSEHPYEYDGVIIKNILDNYVVLDVLKYPFGEQPRSDAVWRYDVKQKKFLMVFDKGGRDRIHILYLDKDKYPDLLVDGSCCMSMILDFYLGSGNGFILVDGFSRYDSYSSYALGSCADMEVACDERGYDDQTEDATISFHRFNCSKRKFEKYAESKLIESNGIIVSIDLNNVSVVIRDNEYSKGVSYKFYKSFESGWQADDLKKRNLQNGDNVSFGYVTIEGKKIILRISKK